MTGTSERHPFTGQPVGPEVDTAPARRPEPVVLDGRYGRVERLRPDHAGALWNAVKGHDPIWTYLSSYGPFANFAAFSEWLAGRVALDDPYSYAIVDQSGRAVGIATLMEIRPAMRVDRGRPYRLLAGACSARRSGPRRNTCSRATRSRRSATGATNGNATRSTHPRGARRCATASSTKAPCASA